MPKCKQIIFTRNKSKLHLILHRHRFSALQRTPSNGWFSAVDLGTKRRWEKKTQNARHPSVPKRCFGNQIISIQRTPKVRTYFWNFRKQENDCFPAGCDCNYWTDEHILFVPSNSVCLISPTQSMSNRHLKILNSVSNKKSYSKNGCVNLTPKIR